MPRRKIEDEVRKNRQTGVRLEGETFTVPARRGETLSVPVGAVEVTVTATLYRRDLGGGLVVNSPDPDSGVNQGVLGDRRTDWQVAQTLDAGNGVFTAAGRQALADALNGSGTALTELTVGTGTSDPSTSDTSLDSRVGAVDATLTQPDDQTLSARGIFEWGDLADTVGEFGADASGGTLLARIKPGEVTLDPDAEVRLDVDFDFSHTGSAAAITDWTSISHALDGGTSVDVTKLALGTDDTAATESDTSLGTEIVRKAATVTASDSKLGLLAIYLEDEPNTNTYDVVEAGAIRSNGTLVWRATFASTTKDDERPLRVDAPLGLRS